MKLINSCSPLVSIIIPNYNHAFFLNQRLESIFNQTYQDFEIIILDDCSTDNSEEIINEYQDHPKIKQIIYNPTNSGSTFKQWQKGVELSSGKYIWIAESDDYCEPDFLSTMINQFRTTDGIGLVYCRSLPINSQNQVYDYSDWWMKRVDKNKWETDYFNNGEDECSKYLSIQCTIPNVSGVLFDINCLKEINWIELKYKVCGDWYLYVTILKKHDIAYIAKPLNYHRNHDNNVRSRNFKTSIIEQYEVLSYLNKIHKINKTSNYYRALDERMCNFITIIKARNISGNEIVNILKKMYHIDIFFIFRFFKIIAFKTFQINCNFI
ncbi:glycosyltransferase family 2 protein [Mucilaginibacter sp. SP1R1]|uniref:glycosyltransferase family 2 protein n=1 Tax=Mucilaginibacter sp. SP1R1 TaxID=2723091 RepID=UPI001612F575|nr:glycosyltransferase [Mucilaginibacter sp. SP1R1]MBB6151000.1 glycosyltransferase involved in cell wall biosynthesis [Mucilaginibacter sp. SP1R1]